MAASIGSRWASFCAGSQSLEGRLQGVGVEGWILLRPRRSHGEKAFSSQTSQGATRAEKMAYGLIALTIAQGNRLRSDDQFHRRCPVRWPEDSVPQAYRESGFCPRLPNSFRRS